MCGRYATTVDPALLAVELDAIDETSGPGVHASRPRTTTWHRPTRCSLW
ncbi:hypothetical protein BTZ20_1866 [Rhodococcus sp. MTM3W5.2]|nr:hypothetical protein BTZ20_1866 [Rhodococcus sp. MTM3W5.2]